MISPVAQTSKSSSTLSPSKTKKNSKDREKRKSQSTTQPSENHNAPIEKQSPNKEKSREYAGIDAECIRIYAEQSAYEFLSDEVCNILTEDINYKLRYIIHSALLKARLLGRNAFNSTDLDETFQGLNIEKIYGAPANPNWVPFGDQNLLYLDDTKINLIEQAEEDLNYTQLGDLEITKKWHILTPDDSHTEMFKTYFRKACQMVVSNDAKLRTAALRHISEDNKIGPIVDWFYNFGYLLLSKDITNNCFTLSALNLIETLENCPIGNENVSSKQLKLLVRLLLQRLLMSKTTEDVLKPMCYVLSILCLRKPLKDFVIMKLNQKMPGIFHNFPLPVLTIILFLGIDGIKEVFLPNINLFFSSTVQGLESIYTILGIYSIICKSSLNNIVEVHKLFYDVFNHILVIFWTRPGLQQYIPYEAKKEVNFVVMKKQLIKSRRKIYWTKKVCATKKNESHSSIESIFELPRHSCRIKSKLDEFNGNRCNKDQIYNNKTIVIGKTTLILSVLNEKCNKFHQKTRNYCDHSLLNYNI